MSSATGPSTGDAEIGVCWGKDCRKRDEHSSLVDAVGKAGAVIPLRCLGICSGPVAVATPRSDEPVVFSKVRSKKQRKQLVRLAVDGERVKKALGTREVTGTKHTKAVRRLRRDV